MSTQTVFTPRYELVYRQNPLDSNDKKWYAKAISNGTIDTEALAVAIRNRCTVTRHDARAVISALQEVMIEYLSMGCSVYLEDLGFFRLECSGKGSQNLADFSPSLIENTKLRFLPSDGLKLTVKSLTSQWISNGVVDAKKSREQAEKENAKG